VPSEREPAKFTLEPKAGLSANERSLFAISARLARHLPRSIRRDFFWNAIWTLELWNDTVLALVDHGKDCDSGIDTFGTLLALYNLDSCRASVYGRPVVFEEVTIEVVVWRHLLVTETLLTATFAPPLREYWEKEREDI